MYFLTKEISIETNHLLLYVTRQKGLEVAKAEKIADRHNGNGQKA